MSKEKYNCAHVVPAPCVPYVGKLPEWSELGDKDECVMVSEVLEEIYDELTRIREAIDVRDIGGDCFNIDGEKTIAKAVYALETKICGV